MKGKTRSLALLIGALAILGVVALLARRGEERQAAGEKVSGPLVAGLDATRVVQVEIAAGGKTQTLKLEGGAWKVLPEGFPADGKALGEALAKLAALEKLELSSSNPEKFSALELKGSEDATTVKLWSDPAAPPLAVVLFGKSGPDYRTGFARLEGETRAWRVSEQLRQSFDRGNRGWRDRSLLTFDPAQAVRLELESADGRLALERPVEGGAWRLSEPVAAPAREAAVDAIVRALSTLEADEFPAASDPATTGLAAPTARARVTLKGGQALELQLGAEAEGGRIWAQRADSDTIVQILAWRKSSIFQRLDALQDDQPPAADADDTPAAADDTPASAP